MRRDLGTVLLWLLPLVMLHGGADHPSADPGSTGCVVCVASDTPSMAAAATDGPTPPSAGPLLGDAPPPALPLRAVPMSSPRGRAPPVLAF